MCTDAVYNNWIYLFQFGVYVMNTLFFPQRLFSKLQIHKNICFLIICSSCDDDDTITSIDDIMETQSDTLSTNDTSTRGGLTTRKSNRVNNTRKKYTETDSMVR